MRPLKSTDVDNNIEKRRLVDELHAPARRNFPRRHVIVRRYNDLWQADIVEMRPYSRFNGGYHYIITVIDVLSKYAWAVPLKGKGGSETADAIAEIIRDSGRCPSNLQTDMGKEFYNTDVQRLVRKHGINHYSTYSVMKVSVVERFNRTLKNNMWEMFTLNGTYKCSKRATRYRYTPNWTTEVFKIVKVQHTNPVTYLLEDYRGKSVAEAFYEYELHCATYPDVYLVEKVLRRRGDEVYVKWLGFDGSHNSWIHKDN
ncbi:uncharacterized protein LOC112452256, partial [Temnothorax curvispinosus]|uniref:Uncharacterized protein LOC112452256 n=1 Tax=Temnothorax curvispinosus TaxID=300111 RepID=A0A6J1PF21_9HYME